MTLTKIDFSHWYWEKYSRNDKSFAVVDVIKMEVGRLYVANNATTSFAKADTLSLPKRFSVSAGAAFTI